MLMDRCGVELDWHDISGSRRLVGRITALLIRLYEIA
jgi:hypothetical protein